MHHLEIRGVHGLGSTRNPPKTYPKYAGFKLIKNLPALNWAGFKLVKNPPGLNWAGKKNSNTRPNSNPNPNNTRSIRTHPIKTRTRPLSNTLTSPSVPSEGGCFKTASIRDVHLDLDKHMENVIKLKSIIMQVDDPLESMLTVDYLQKLGIDYHFKQEIEAMLCSLLEKISEDDDQGGEQIKDDDLFQVALSFRLLRQAGYPISSDVFMKFVDKEGRFKSTLRKDVQGLLSLYEASYLSMGEDILYKAKEFSRKHLTSCIEYLEPNVAKLVSHALKNPCHTTISRYNARYYLDHCPSAEGCRINGVLEEFARLDFKLVQSLHQKELEEILSWWKSTGLAEELDFARNQPLKWYMWPMTVVPDPQFSRCRIHLTKVIAFIYIIDDIFDIYGSPEELYLLTNAISKWDISIVETLPTYMQACYIALHNIAHEIAQTTFEEQGWNPISSIRESWTRLCNAFLLESRWLRSKHIPKPDEYLRNAVISTGVHTVLMHAFFLLGQRITKENVEFLESNPPLLSCPATILRLWDDLGSAKDENQEGFDGSYVECYMKENLHLSSQSARDHVKQMISNTWEVFNKECFSRGHFAPNLVSASLNSARMVEVMYRYDENQNLPILKEYINALLFKSL